MSILKEQFKKELNRVYGLIKEAENNNEAGDAGLEAGIEDILSSDDSAPPEGKETGTPDDTTVDKEQEPEQKKDDETSEPPESKDEEPDVVPGTGDISPQAETDSSKVETLFKDMGNPETDYGLTNPANIRLARFKFKKAGIEVAQLMNDVEAKTGITADKLILRLTPEQFESYRDRGKELRKKYDLIAEREKNIILFNARIPMYSFDENTKSLKLIDEHDPNLLKNAFKKINSFLVEKFGENWVDDFNAVDFIHSIKINFANNDSITPNMLTTKFFEDNVESKIVPFNKLFVKTPPSVDAFIKETKEDQNLKRSAVYRTIAAGYLNDSTDSNGVYVTLKADDNSSGQEKGDIEKEADAVDQNEPEQEAPVDEVPGEEQV
jgi:hypothetical protein